jgi:Tfp pilus assembly protein PilN
LRPVNLTPPEERGGRRASRRTSSISYLVLAALALGVLAVTALVLTTNTINDRKSEISELEAREAAARSEAGSLRAFAEFGVLAEARAQTVTSLAQSRFDWERVLRELALVIPGDVWLVELSGAASPDVQVENAAEVSAGSNIAGPALSMVGCATSHEAVARFLQALKDIDGVTRVGLGKSERASSESAGTNEEGSDANDRDCRTRDFITRFEIVAAFDEVPVPPLETETAPTVPAPAAESTQNTGDGSGIADADAQAQEAGDSTDEQTDEARTAANLVPGVVE